MRLSKTVAFFYYRQITDKSQPNNNEITVSFVLIFGCHTCIMFLSVTYYRTICYVLFPSLTRVINNLNNISWYRIKNLHTE